MSQNQTMPKSDLKSANECTPYIMYEIEVKGKSLDTAYSSWKTSQPGPFNPRLFNPMVQKPMFEKSGWKVHGWKVPCWSLGLKSPGLRCPSTHTAAFMTSKKIAIWANSDRKNRWIHLYSILIQKIISFPYFFIN